MKHQLWTIELTVIEKQQQLCYWMNGYNWASKSTKLKDRHVCFAVNVFLCSWCLISFFYLRFLMGIAVFCHLLPHFHLTPCPSRTLYHVLSYLDQICNAPGFVVKIANFLSRLIALIELFRLEFLLTGLQCQQSASIFWPLLLVPFPDLHVLVTCC